MVAGIQLLDAIVKTPPPYGDEAPVDLQVRTAKQLVAACLDEFRHIQALDACGPTGKWRRLYVRETEAQMRQIHEAWLSQARPLLERVREMTQAGRTVEQTEELEDAVLTTRGALKMTLDDIEQGMEEIRQGRGHHYDSIEDLRRDIRAESERRRTEIPGVAAVRTAGGGVGPA